MAEKSRARVASAGAVVLIAVVPTAAGARADPPDAQTAAPTAASGSFPSIGRFEIVQGVGRNPPLMLDTSSGTTWSLAPDGEPNGFGWVRVGVMDASEAATARRLPGRAPDAGRGFARRRHSAAASDTPPPRG